MSYLTKIRRAARRLSSEREHLLRTIKQERKQFKEYKQTLKRSLKAQVIVQTIAQSVQQQAHERVAKVVSQCLEAVFDERYQFQILFERKRGKTEAKLIFTKDGNVINPKESGSGGVIDVAAFALRIACILWSKPPKRRFVALDEPFRFVHETCYPKIEQLLTKLATDLNIQFVVVTHLPLRSGTVVQI